MIETTILGAGVMGLAIATELAARGIKPRIIDPAGKPGAHACSWRAGGMLAPYCEAESAEPVVLRLGLDAADWWQAQGAEVIRRGTLVLAPSRDRLPVPPDDRNSGWPDSDRGVPSLRFSPAF